MYDKKTLFCLFLFSYTIKKHPFFFPSLFSPFVCFDPSCHTLIISAITSWLPAMGTCVLHFINISHWSSVITNTHTHTCSKLTLRLFTREYWTRTGTDLINNDVEAVHLWRLDKDWELLNNDVEAVHLWRLDKDWDLLNQQWCWGCSVDTCLINSDVEAVQFRDRTRTGTYLINSDVEAVRLRRPDKDWDLPDQPRCWRYPCWGDWTPAARTVTAVPWWQLPRWYPHPQWARWGRGHAGLSRWTLSCCKRCRSGPLPLGLPHHVHTTVNTMRYFKQTCRWYGMQP